MRGSAMCDAVIWLVHGQACMRIMGVATCRAQTEITQGIFGRIHGNGHVVQRTNQQLYSVALEKFLADRYVVGTCPKCGYEDARGDQCDNCGSLLNPTELRNPRCKFSGTEPVLRETSHLYIDLPQLEAKLRIYIDAASKQVRSPAPRLLPQRPRLIYIFRTFSQLRPWAASPPPRYTSFTAVAASVPCMVAMHGLWQVLRCAGPVLISAGIRSARRGQPQRGAGLRMLAYAGARASRGTRPWRVWQSATQAHPGVEPAFGGVRRPRGICMHACNPQPCAGLGRTVASRGPCAHHTSVAAHERWRSGRRCCAGWLERELRGDDGGVAEGRPEGAGNHARPEVGHAGPARRLPQQGLLRLVRRADRVLLDHR